MSRNRSYYGPRRKRRYDRYNDWYDDSSYPRRRGCFAALRRFVWRVLVTIMILVGIVVGVIALVLILSHVAAFLVLLKYLVYVGAGLAALGLLYLVVRIFVAISHRISAASTARSKARIEREHVRIERERARQAHTQVQMQQVHLAREEYALAEKYQPQWVPPSRKVQMPVQFAQEANTIPPSLSLQRPKATRHLTVQESEPEENSPSPVPSALSNQVQQSGEKKAPSPAIPSIGHLLDKTVKAGQREIVHGFRVSNGTIEEVRGELPGTAIIAGKSGSGKTRRIILMVFQALLMLHALGKGYKITVCDPHFEKPDGLLKVLAPFIPWLHIAKTKSEIVAAAQEHLDELESRLVPGGSQEDLRPRLLIIDEFPKLMRGTELSKAEKRIIADAVRKSAVEYRGVFGYAWIIGQEWTQDAIFDTAIRKDVQAIFCHQLSVEYADYLFPLQTKIQRTIQEIERRECVFKDADNHVLRITTTTVTDDEIPALVAYLERHVPRQQMQQAAPVKNPAWYVHDPVPASTDDGAWASQQTLPDLQAVPWPAPDGTMQRTLPLAQAGANVQQRPAPLVLPAPPQDPWMETVLVPENELERVVANEHPPHQRQKPVLLPPPDPFALLAQAQRRKKAR